MQYLVADPVHGGDDGRVGVPDAHCGHVRRRDGPARPRVHHVGRHENDRGGGRRAPLSTRNERSKLLQAAAHSEIPSLTDGRSVGRSRGRTRARARQAATAEAAPGERGSSVPAACSTCERARKRTREARKANRLAYRRCRCWAAGALFGSYMVAHERRNTRVTFLRKEVNCVVRQQ